MESELKTFLFYSCYDRNIFSLKEPFTSINFVEKYPEDCLKLPLVFSAERFQGNSLSIALKVTACSQNMFNNSVVVKISVPKIGGDQTH